MTTIHATLCTQENRGDYAADVRLAAEIEPGETVEHLVVRLMRAGEFARLYQHPEPPTAWIELRYVEGTLPAADPAPSADPWASHP